MSGVTARRITDGEAGMRLDRWFRAHFPALGHGALQKLMRTGQVRIDGKRAKADARVEPGQTIRIPPLPAEEGAPAQRGDSPFARPRASGKRETDDPEAFLKSITLYEDEDVFVFNKPHGLAVQGGSGLSRHIDGMLPALASRRGDIPRLVHRLDRDTSGAMVVARTRKAAAELSKAFRARTTKKIYWALAFGVPRLKQGRLSTFLVKEKDDDGNDRVRVTKAGGEASHALTYYAVVETAAQKLAWISLRPVTGRTHQLRVHLAELGHPIIGDPKYFNVENWELPGGIQNVLHLHARRIALPLPSGKVLDVSAPLPAHMQQTWNLLGFDARQYDPIEESPEK